MEGVVGDGSDEGLEVCFAGLAGKMRVRWASVMVADVDFGPVGS